MTQLQYQVNPEPNKLSWQERERFNELKSVIGTNLGVFKDVVAAFSEIHEKRLYRENYSSFDAFLKTQCNGYLGPISRVRAWQLMESDKTIKAIEAENVNRGLHLPIPDGERITRPMNSLPVDDRPSAWALAVENAGGGIPSGPQVAQTVQSLAPTPTPEQATSSRIGNLEVDRKAKPPTAPTSKRAFGYIEADSVQTLTRDRRLTFTYFRPAYTIQTREGAKQVKAMKAEGLAIPFRVLESQGWTAPVLTDEERERYEPDDDKPVSLLEGRDLSQVRRKAQPEANVASEAMTLMLGDDDDAPPPSFTSGIDFTDLDALSQPFGDDYTQ